MWSEPYVGRGTVIASFSCVVIQIRKHRNLSMLSVATRVTAWGSRRSWGSRRFSQLANAEIAGTVICIALHPYPQMASSRQTLNSTTTTDFCPVVFPRGDHGLGKARTTGHEKYFTGRIVSVGKPGIAQSH
jgi:hypothetical protein